MCSHGAFRPPWSVSVVDTGRVRARQFASYRLVLVCPTQGHKYACALHRVPNPRHVKTGVRQRDRISREGSLYAAVEPIGAEVNAH